jgi:hypothetical protein
LWRFAIRRLADANQAPRALFYLIRELVEVLGSDTDIIEGLARIHFIPAHHGLHP